MGFTRFWRRPRELDIAAFAQFAVACQRECGAFKGTLVNARFDIETVSFDGLPGCEPFVLNRVSNGRENAGRISEFCKTQKLPYDAAVAKCLHVLKEFFPEAEVLEPS